MQLSYVVMLLLSVGYVSALPQNVFASETRLVDSRDKMLGWRQTALKGKGKKATRTDEKREDPAMLALKI